VRAEEKEGDGYRCMDWCWEFWEYMENPVEILSVDMDLGAGSLGSKTEERREAV